MNVFIIFFLIFDSNDMLIKLLLLLLLQTALFVPINVVQNLSPLQPYCTSAVVTSDSKVPIAFCCYTASTARAGVLFKQRGTEFKEEAANFSANLFIFLPPPPSKCRIAKLLFKQ